MGLSWRLFPVSTFRPRTSLGTSYLNSSAVVNLSSWCSFQKMDLLQETVSTLAFYSYYIFVGVVAFGVALYLARRYFAGGVCHSKALLNGKTVIITGANAGIGKETAVDLARRNARVIMACRSVEKGEKAAVEVRKRSGSDNVVFLQLDLASLTSVRQFAARVLEEEPRLDILINNAGVMACPYTKTEDGFEMQFGVNHLAHFLLTNLLLDRLKEAPSARIVNLSSLAHAFGKINFDDLNSEKSYSSWSVYSQSKLANILFTRSLAKRLQGTNTIVNAVHPGGVRTELQRHSFVVRIMRFFSSIFWKTPEEGAQTSIYCAVSEEMEGVSGKYLADCKIVKPRTKEATDDEIAERLWQVSVQMVGLESKQ